MSEFTELLDAYTKLKAEYDELFDKAFKLAESDRRLEEAVQNRNGLIIDGVKYIPAERATIVQLPNGFRFGEPIYDVISEGA